MLIYTCSFEFYVLVEDIQPKTIKTMDSAARLAMMPDYDTLGAGLAQRSVRLKSGEGELHIITYYYTSTDITK